MKPMNLIPTNTGELGLEDLANIHWQNFAQWAVGLGIGKRKSKILILPP